MRGIWLLFVLLLLGPTQAWGDTPLTSARIHTGYGDVHQVAAAAEGGVLTPQVVTFLASDAPTDVKAAVVSAVGWRSPGVSHGRAFLDHLAAANGLTAPQLSIDRMRAVDLFVYGYLIAMDDPHELRPVDPAARGPLSLPPWEVLSIAAAALPGDFTIQLVRALVEGQRDASSAWCAVYLEGRLVLERFPPTHRNLRPDASAQVQAVFEGYASSCGSPLAKPQAPPPSPVGGSASAVTTQPPIPPKPELNQVYAVTQFKDLMATATQGGVVLWSRGSQKPVGVRLEPICTEILTRGEALWAGCEHAVLRYDGQRWKRYLADPSSSEPYKVRLAHDGSLVVAHAGQLYLYKEAYDAFSAAPAHMGSGEGYDLRWDLDGQLWRVHFMSGVSRGETLMAVGSAAYPGSDPRSLYADEGGGVWVVDFADGFYRYDDVSARFTRVPGVASRGSAVAIDAERQRVWLLHYNDGVYLRDGAGPARFFNLRRLQYLRDIYVDADGDVWIAGWTQLLRLRQDGGHWAMEDWKVEVF